MGRNDLQQAEMARLAQERLDAEQHLQKLKADIDRVERAASYVDRVEALAARLSAGLEAMDFELRRSLMRLFVEEVIYDAGNLTIKDDSAIRSIASGRRGRGRVEAFGRG